MPLVLHSFNFYRELKTTAQGWNTDRLVNQEFCFPAQLPLCYNGSIQHPHYCWPCINWALHLTQRKQDAKIFKLSSIGKTYKWNLGKIWQCGVTLQPFLFSCRSIKICCMATGFNVNLQALQHIIMKTFKSFQEPIAPQKCDSSERGKRKFPRDTWRPLHNLLGPKVSEERNIPDPHSLLGLGHCTSKNIILSSRSAYSSAAHQFVSYIQSIHMGKKQLNSL